VWRLRCPCTENLVDQSAELNYYVQRKYNLRSLELENSKAVELFEAETAN